MCSIVGGETVARLMLAAVLAMPQAVLQELVPETLAQGAQSRIEQPRQVVVRTVEAWRALWAAHAGPAATAPRNAARSGAPTGPARA